MKGSKFPFVLIALAFAALPIQGMADIVFTARPAIDGATYGCPMVVELRWQNRGQTVESVDIGTDQRGGIDVITSDEKVHHNQRVRAGLPKTVWNVPIQPGKSLEMVVLLDEWISLNEGHNSFAFAMSGGGGPMQAKLELDVKKNSPEACMTVLSQLIRAANSTRNWNLKFGYLDAISRVYRSSEAGKKVVIETCNSLGFKNFHAEVQKYLREKQAGENAID